MTASSTQDVEANEYPVEIVILTSEIALFADLSRESHSKASQLFLKRVEHHFKCGRLDLLQIYVMDNRMRTQAKESPHKKKYI